MKCPAKIKLEAYYLEKRFAEAIEPHLAACPPCQSLLQEMDSERMGFLQARPFSKLWNEIEPRMTEATPSWKRALQKLLVPGAFAGTLALAGLAGLMLVTSRPQAPVEPEILIKGGVGLSFYAASAAGGQVLPGKDGMDIPAGTQIQFVYTDSENPYLCLIGVEADGTTTTYFSDSASGTPQSAPIQMGTHLKLPQGLRWEPKTDYERFFAVFSAKPVSVDDVRGAIASLSAQGKTVEHSSKLPLPYSQASILLHRKNGK